MSATSHRPFAPAPLIPAALASPTGPKRWYRRVPLLFPAGFTKWSGRGLDLGKPLFTKVSHKPL